MARRSPDLFTRDDKELSQTIRLVIGNSEIMRPLSMPWLIECIEKMPFSMSLHFDKRLGRYLCSNQHMDSWPDESFKDHCSGRNFTFIDHTMEMALARAVHYYFHLELREEVK